MPDKNRRQDVWSKQWNDPEKRDKIEERKAIAARSSSIEITKRVRNGEFNLKLNKDHFEKHHEGNRRFEDYYRSRIKKGYGLQSILMIDYDEAQRLIYDNYGKGIVTVTKAGKARSEEEFDFHKVIGYYVYDGKKYPTTKGRIIYSKKGSHIIPIKGEYFD
ncbi:polymorphic toxin type 50 domain-containing protein [Anaerococcus vaginimassiliensis]|uniref:polymorphic toxin type 50 domain-containing protein n=1 Tax=Anaerococcus vaginimassiliensis TaxID=2042308 RepID=UPI0010305726|nr:polymorphic toxin type 50 domain-containing protein [Anaerococcus vaginimassiliensis]